VQNIFWDTLLPCRLAKCPQRYFSQCIGIRVTWDQQERFSLHLTSTSKLNPFRQLFSLFKFSFQNSKFKLISAAKRENQKKQRFSA